MKKKATKVVVSIALAAGMTIGGFGFVSSAQAYTGTANTTNPSKDSTWRYGIAQKYTKSIWTGKNILINDYVWSDFIDSDQTHRSSVKNSNLTAYTRSGWVNRGYWAKIHVEATVSGNLAAYAWY